MKRHLQRIALVLLGLSIAFLAQYIALGLAGAGHGWISPFFASLILFVTLPFALVRVADRASRSPIPDYILLGIGALADIWLVVRTIGEARYFRQILDTAPDFVIGWLTIWLGAQLLAAIALIARIALNRRRGFLDTPLDPS